MYNFDGFVDHSRMWCIPNVRYSNQVQGVSEEPQPSGIDPDCRILFLRGKSVEKGAQIGRSRTLF